MGGKEDAGGAVSIGGRRIGKLYRTSPGMRVLKDSYCRMWYHWLWLSIGEAALQTDF